MKRWIISIIVIVMFLSGCGGKEQRTTRGEVESSNVVAFMPVITAGDRENRISPNDIALVNEYRKSFFLEGLSVISEETVLASIKENDPREYYRTYTVTANL